MNGVLGMAQIGHRESAGRERSRKMFSRILESGRLLLAIVNDVLDFSKIEAGKLAIEAVPVDPRLIVDEAISALELPAGQKGIALVADKDASLPPGNRALPEYVYDTGSRRMRCRRHGVHHFQADRD